MEENCLNLAAFKDWSGNTLRERPVNKHAEQISTSIVRNFIIRSHLVLFRM